MRNGEFRWVCMSWGRTDTSADLVQGIQIIPGALMCIMIPLVPETPRYLINHGKSDKGLRNLTLLRRLPMDHPYVQTEFQEIEAQFLLEQEARKGHNYWIVLKDVFTNRSNFRRFFLVSQSSA
jgi:hypothetical protein